MRKKKIWGRGGGKKYQEGNILGGGEDDHVFVWLASTMDGHQSECEIVFLEKSAKCSGDAIEKIDMNHEMDQKIANK